jgi:hypothetical protein
MSENGRLQNAFTSLRRLSAQESRAAGAQKWIPAWSSHVLETTVAEILSRAGASIGDLFRSSWKLAGESDVELSPAVANFFRDIVVLCFTRYRKLYDAEDLQWMADQVRGQITPSQAYLALLALPENHVEQTKTSILRALEGTDFLNEARKMLS